MLTLVGSSHAETLTIAGGTFTGMFSGTYSNFVNILVQTLGGTDVINLGSPTATASVDSGDGSDTVTITETAIGADVVIVPSVNGNLDTISINPDGSGTATARVDADQAIGPGRRLLQPARTSTSAGRAFASASAPLRLPG